MTANPYRPAPRQDVKELIEEMREEFRVETGGNIKKPSAKPKGKPKRPATPIPSHPKKPKKALKIQVNAPRMTEKEFIFGLKLYNKTKAGKKNPINIKKKVAEVKTKMQPAGWFKKKRPSWCSE